MLLALALSSTFALSAPSEPSEPSSSSSSSPPPSSAPASPSEEAAPPPSPAPASASPAAAPLPFDPAWSVGAGLAGVTFSNTGISIDRGAAAGVERRVLPWLWLTLDASGGHVRTLDQGGFPIPGETTIPRHDTRTTTAALGIGARFFAFTDGPVRPSLHVRVAPFIEHSTSDIEVVTRLSDDVTDVAREKFATESLVGGGSVVAGGAVDVPFFDGRLAVRLSADVVRGRVSYGHEQVFNGSHVVEETPVREALEMSVSPTLQLRAYF